MRTRHRRAGASLVELLVAIGVIGVLVGLLMTAVQNVRHAAGRTACANNLRQVALACHNYEAGHGQLPPPFFMETGAPARRPKFGPTWQALLLPHLEHEQLWSGVLPAYRQAHGVYNPPHVGLAVVIKAYTCVSDGRLNAPITDDLGYTAAYGSYLGVSGSGDGSPTGAFRGRIGVRFAEITDGQSQTLLLGERPPPGKYLAGNWYTDTIPFALAQRHNFAYGSTLRVVSERDHRSCRGPFHFGPGRLDNPCDSHHFWSLHPGGGNFALADGSVRFITYAAASSLPSLATLSGGEIVDMTD